MRALDAFDHAFVLWSLDDNVSTTSHISDITKFRELFQVPHIRLCLAENHLLDLFIGVLHGPSGDLVDDELSSDILEADSEELAAVKLAELIQVPYIRKVCEENYMLGMFEGALKAEETLQV